MVNRRRHVIVTGIVLAVAGACVSMVAIGWISWKLAVDRELAQLEQHARTVVARAEKTYAEVWETLNDVEFSGLDPCSDAHIDRMRVLTVEGLSVEEIGYFEDGFLKCTSWGPTAQPVPQAHTDYLTFNGLSATLAVKPSIRAAGQMTALRLGRHHALVVPSRFVDVVFKDRVSIALFSAHWQPISMMGDADLVAAAALAKQQGGNRVDGANLVSVFAENGVVAVVTQSISHLKSRILAELVFLAPVGLFIAAFIIAIVYWLSKRRLSPRAELDIAVRKREFIVHYQPIMDLKTGACIGAEALVRWRRPDGSMVRPDLFIPLAEETGLVLPLTDLVVDGVIRDLGQLLTHDRNLHIAINISAQDMKTGRILHVVEEKLQGTGINRDQIWLEATERGFMEVEKARGTLDRARAAGHPVVIDDFGTGYSSLQYLSGLPLDALKIDKSFVDTIGRNSATSSVTLHIIGMARELGLLTVAEGIETEDQAEYLRQHEVTYGQGWLFAKAMPVEEFMAYYREASRTAAPPARA